MVGQRNDAKSLFPWNTTTLSYNLHIRSVLVRLTLIQRSGFPVKDLESVVEPENLSLNFVSAHALRMHASQHPSMSRIKKGVLLEFFVLI